MWNLSNKTKRAMHVFWEKLNYVHHSKPSFVNRVAHFQSIISGWTRKKIYDIKNVNPTFSCRINFMDKRKGKKKFIRNHSLSFFLALYTYIIGMYMKNHRHQLNFTSNQTLCRTMSNVGLGALFLSLNHIIKWCDCIFFVF